MHRFKDNQINNYMKFQINSRTLANALGNQLRVVNTKNALSILDNFKLEIVEPNGLAIVASDQEITSIVGIDVESDAISGTCCIDARKFTDLVRKFGDKPMMFETHDSHSIATITCGKGKYELPIISSAEYPQRPIENEGFFTLPTTTLIEGLNVTKGMVSNESIRPILCGVHVNIQEQGIDFVATDTHKLVVSRHECNAGLEPKAITLPIKVVGLILSHFAKFNEIQVGITDKGITIKADGVMITSNLIKGNYPNYNRVIPQDGGHHVKVNRKELMDAIGRVSGFASNASNLLVLEDGGMMEMKVSARDLDYGQSGEDFIMTDGFPQGFKIGLNSEFFIQVLGIMNEDEVTMQMSDPSRPVKIVEGGITAIQMPMQVME